MQCRIAVFASLAVLGISLTAHATPTTYTISGDSGQLTGTVVLDSSGIYSGDVNFNDGSNTYTFDGSNLGSGVAFGSYIYLQLDDATFDELLLYVPLPGSGDITICSTAAPCIVPGPPPFGDTNLGSKLILYPNDTTYYVSTGYLDPNAVSATPEPGSLVLLCTGLLGVLGVMRRRVLRA